MAGPTSFDSEHAVRERYAAASRVREAALCCPVDYDARYLAAIPPEVIERDYGCGDPSRHVRAGDVVLDLGCGGGKICFIAAQVVGKRRARDRRRRERRDARARARAAPRVAATRRLRQRRVPARAYPGPRAAISTAVDAWLAEHPVRSSDDARGARGRAGPRCAARRRSSPDASVDVVVSNCVLNLVRERDKRALIGEIFRVLRVGGRIAISDIVSDEPVPAAPEAMTRSSGAAASPAPSRSASSCARSRPPASTASRSRTGRASPSPWSRASSSARSR